MKLLFVHNDYGRYSGEEHAIDAIAGLFRERGHTVVWYRRSSTEVRDRLAGKAKAFAAAFRNPAAERAVRNLVRTEKPDAAFVQNLYPLISPAILDVLKNEGVPIVMRCPNYRLFCPSGLLYSKNAVCEKCLAPGRELWCILRNCEGSLPKSIAYAARNAYARKTGAFRQHVDIFITPSRFKKNWFAARGIPEDRIHVVPNMVPPALPPDLDGRGRIIGFIGRIAPEKGFTDFIEAARNMPDLAFAAAGAVKKGYEGKLTRLPENLAMAGFLADKALHDFLGDMKMLVTCSTWYEGFPNTIAMSMAARRPVIASRIGAIPEIVDDGVTGLLYPPGDIDALVAAIRRIASDDALCRSLGEAGYRKACRHYSRDAVGDKLERAVRAAIEHHASA